MQQTTAEKFLQLVKIMDELRERGIAVEVVRAPMDKRFMVYILGRGVPLGAEMP